LTSLAAWSRSHRLAISRAESMSEAPAPQPGVRRPRRLSADDSNLPVFLAAMSETGSGDPRKGGHECFSRTEGRAS
jgi:hypothetical protein